jgi:hypothetical protein
MPEQASNASAADEGRNKKIGKNDANKRLKRVVKYSF